MHRYYDYPVRSAPSFVCLPVLCSFVRGWSKWGVDSNFWYVGNVSDLGKVIDQERKGKRGKMTTMMVMMDDEDNKKRRKKKTTKIALHGEKLKH